MWHWVMVWYVWLQAPQQLVDRGGYPETEGRSEWNTPTVADMVSNSKCYNNNNSTFIL